MPSGHRRNGTDAVLRLFFACLLLSCVVMADRTVSLTVNPGCDDICEKLLIENNRNVNLVYVKAVGSNDTVHYLWSSIGSFGVLLAKTPLSSQLNIEWDKLLSDNPSSSINFTSPPFYLSTAVFTNLWMYDDVDDNADISQAQYNFTTRIPFHELSWEPVTAANVSEHEVMAEFDLMSKEGSNYGNKTLKIKLNAFGGTDHYEKLPHLIHTSSSFQSEVVLDNFATNYTNTRFAFEVAIFGDAVAESGNYLLEKYVSIDDEYTPGVFKTVQIISPQTQFSGLESYVLWKPVCYTSSDRTTEYSTDAKANQQNISFSMRELEITLSLANAFYGSGISNQSAGFVNISFGLEEDGFYQATNYISWTATFGLGTPPTETFSTLVIVVIIVGFGLPGILTIFGSFYMIVRRLRSKNDELRLDNPSKVPT